jgi:ferredoxin-NADP reductase
LIVREGIEMPAFQVTLQSSEPIAEGTMAFHLDKPEGFRFQPGQAIGFTLIDPQAGDQQGKSHTFSLVSAPSESRLTVATRMRASAFKRALKALPAGAVVKVNGPHGSMTLDDNATRPAAFLAGGIGITPFMSMLRQAAKDGLLRRMYLFYSNRRAEDAPFLEELRQLVAQNPNFTFVPTLTQPERSREKWEGETGKIDTKLLTKYISDLSSPVFYVAGPPGMVDAMRELLNEAGVNGDAVRSEEFFGY